MLLEIHMLKNYPPTNLNRDDTGAPKTCLFGGVNRGRISSQCLKRSWRTSDIFREEIGAENLGIRTRKLPELVANRLLELGISQEFVSEIKPKISGFGNKDCKENSRDPSCTAQMIFYSPEDIDVVALAIKERLEKCQTVKDVKAIKIKDFQDVAKQTASVRPVTLDIALFGRMVTSDAFRDVEAAMQVAHAVSTNKVSVESDYFTAMDDLLTGTNLDETGAGMIGDIDYNSSCYYLYASLDTDVLRESLKYSDNADVIITKTIPALLRAIAFSNPSGKQNSFAGHVLPSCMMIECKDKKIPVSLINAFTEPVKGNDLVKESILKMANEADMIDDSFKLPIKARHWFCVNKYDIHPKCASSIYTSFQEFADAVSQMI